MAFPTTLPSYIITAGSETANGAGGGTGLSGLLNAFEVDITALGTKMGTGASTPVANTILYGTGAGTSAWQGLTSAQLASIISDETGSGSLVFGNSPTIVTPTIASFTNAQHSHSNAAGGGVIANAAITTQMAALTLIGVDGSTVNPIPSAEADIASSSQTFSVNTASYAIIVMSTTIQINTANDAFMYLNVDGSNQARYIQAEAPSTLGGPRWTGSRIFKISLAAGSHTIKLRCSATAAGISVAYDPSWYGILVSQ